MKLAEAPFGIVAVESSKGNNVATVPFTSAETIATFEPGCQGKLATLAGLSTATMAVLIEINSIFVIEASSTLGNRPTGSSLAIQAEIIIVPATAATVNNTIKRTNLLAFFID